MTPLRREEIALAVIAGHLHQAEAVRVSGVTAKIVRRWTERYRLHGHQSMADHSSRPQRSPARTQALIVEQVIALRRQRLTGCHIAQACGVSAATVSRILTRAGLNRLRQPDPAEPIRWYQRDKPGELIHIDIKKLGKFNRVGHRISGDRTGQSNAHGIGWEFVHV